MAAAITLDYLEAEPSELEGETISLAPSKPVEFDNDSRHEEGAAAALVLTIFSLNPAVQALYPPAPLTANTTPDPSN